MNVCSYTPIRNIADVKGINERFSTLFKQVCYLASVTSSGINIYNSGGTLTGNRTLNGDKNSLFFNNVLDFNVNAFSASNQQRAFLSLDPTSNQASSLIFIDLDEGGDASIEVKGGFIQSLTSSGGNSGYHVFKTTQAYFLNSDGDVSFYLGIDNDNPTHTLELGSTFKTASSLHYLGNNGDDAVWYQQSSDANYLRINGDDERILFDESDQDIRTIFGGTSGDYPLTVRAAGNNVGGYGIIQAGIQNTSTEVGMQFDNLGTGGRNYNFFSTNEGSGIGGGKFSINDATAGQARITIDEAANIGINNSNPVETLDINGNLRTINFYTVSGEPTIIENTGAGTTPSVVDIAGTNNGGTISITTGSLPAANAIIASITFTGFSFPNGSSTVLTAGNAATALLNGVTAVHVTNDIDAFAINSGSTGLTALTSYVWNYIVQGY